MIDTALWALVARCEERRWRRVAQTRPRGVEQVLTLPFAGKPTRVLEFAVHEAAVEDRALVEPRHTLLALVRENDASLLWIMACGRVSARDARRAVAHEVALERHPYQRQETEEAARRSARSPLPQKEAPVVGIVFLYVMWFVIVAFMLLLAALTSRGSG